MIASLVGYIIAFMVVGLSLLYLKWHKKVKQASHIPTPKGMLPIVGHAMSLPKDITLLLEYNKEVFRELKSKIQVLWLGFWPLINVFDVSILEDVLKSSKYATKGANYQLLADWLKTGLVTSNGKKWKSRRRLLTPAFHFGIVKSSAAIINRHASLMVHHLKEKVAIDHIVEMEEFFKSFSLAVICETAMGVQCNLYKTSGTKEHSDYVAAVNEIQDLLISQIFKPWLHNYFVYKYLSKEGKRYYKAVDVANSFVRNIIELRINSLEQEKSYYKSSIFVDILIDAYKKNEIDIEGILEEVNTFMFAGYDTVSTALAWIIFGVGCDESVQEKLYEEIKSLDFDFDLDADCVSQLKYLDCVVKESLRLYPPALAVSRHLEEDALLGGQKIPAKSVVILNFYFLHRDETIWENSAEFIPERFLKYNSEKRNPYAYCPFSAGPRNCIGQRFAVLEMKIILCYLIRNFKFKSIQKESDMLIYFSAVLRSKNEIWVEISERK